MLDDRSYMRESETRSRLPFSVTTALLITNLLVFVALEINKAYNFSGFATIVQYCALSNSGLAHGFFWQLITFQFLHANGWHFVLNMLGLYLLGRPVEDAAGGRKYLAIYLGGGVVGGLLQILLGWFVPPVFGLPVVGASAGIFALIGAFAALGPDQEVLVFFILPMRAKYFAFIAAAVALFYILVPTEPGVAHGAHLGGLLAGVAAVRWSGKRLWSFQWPWRRIRPVPRPVPREQVVSFVYKTPVWPKVTTASSEPAEEEDFMAREVDPILEKISAKGLQSLTERERRILETARNRIGKG